MQSILQPCNSAREAIIKPIAICPEKQTLAGWLRGGGGAQCSQLRVHSPLAFACELRTVQCTLLQLPTILISNSL